MVFVAVLLLPLMSVLLLVMDRIEGRLLDPAPARHRHAAARRHLRLIPGDRRATRTDDAAAEQEHRVA